MTYRRTALLLPLAFVLVSCSDRVAKVADAAVSVLDAAVDAAVDAATDAAGDASAQGPVEMAVTCDQTATRTVDGTVTTIKYADVTVAVPSDWYLVQCGRIGASRNYCAAGSTCSGTLPEYPDCYAGAVQFTGAKVHVECEYDIGGVAISGSTTNKLVHR